MNKTKLLIGLIAVLVLVNVALLVKLNSRGNHLPPHEVPKMKIIEELKLNDDQIKQYEGLIDAHRKAMHANDEKILELRTQLYKQLTTITPSQKDSLIVELGELQKRTEAIHFNHFEGIRKICSAEQQKKFEAFSTELARLFSKPRPHRKPE